MAHACPPIQTVAYAVAVTNATSSASRNVPCLVCRHSRHDCRASAASLLTSGRRMLPVTCNSQSTHGTGTTVVSPAGLDEPTSGLPHHGGCLGGRHRYVGYPGTTLLRGSASGRSRGRVDDRLALVDRRDWVCDQ